MTKESFPPAPKSPSQPLIVIALIKRPGVAAAALAIVLTLLILASVPFSLTPDIFGQLWIAHHMRQGARLYLDISEINPPLWFWMAMPIDALADVLRVKAESVLIAAVGAAALGSLLGTDRLLGHMSVGARRAFLSYAALILLVMPLRDFAQREQLALIGAMPYVALIAARREGRQVSASLALLVGVGAALGFALKHYFIGVPLMLEAWLALSLRRAWRPIRPETAAMTIGAVGYGVAIMLLTPGFLQVSVPETLLGYAAFGAPSLAYMIRPAQPIWVLILCAILAQRPLAQRRSQPLTVALLIGAAGFLAAWLIQHKGWPYQSVPTTGLLALAVAAALAERAKGDAVRARMLVTAALVLPILLAIVPTQWKIATENDIDPALADLPPGATVAIVSAEARTAWPAAVGREFRFSGRRGTYWVLAAVDANAVGRRDPRIDVLGAGIVHQTAMDYRCLPPERIVFARPYSDGTGTSASGAPLRYFLRDGDFARLLGHYRLLPLHGNFDAYELAIPFRPATGASCPRGL